jgi:WD40 repeat protein
LPERAAGLARITRHWPVRDWSTVPSAGLPFPGVLLESWRAMEVHPATGRVLLQTGAGPVRVLDLAAQTEKPLIHEAGQTPVRSMRFDPSGRFAVLVDEDSGVSVFDVATGESVMPRQFCPEGIEWAALTSDGLLAVAVYPNRIRRWPVRPAMELPEKLRAQAEVLSGRRLDGRGQLVWLTGSNLVERLR